MNLRALLIGLLASAALAPPGVAAHAAAIATPAPANASAPLAFRIDEGRNLNAFLQEGPVAAHLLLRSGTEPRILVAFPAGNSGIGLWFQTTSADVQWKLIMPPRALRATDEKHRPLYGIEFEVEASVPELRPRAAVLSSIRVLRDYELQRQAPVEVRVEPRVGQGISWVRNRLDGAAGFRLRIEAPAGTHLAAYRFAGKGALRLKIQALSGEAPLTPLPSLLTAAAGDDTRARNALAFLSYREKFLAGSWRFDTYFGRDTLIAALLLGDALEPAAVESALESVLDRLAPDGEVAHEEDIGEFAVLRNAREGRGRVATPIYDYGMVDDDFMLAPLAARWLLDDALGRVRARAFLAADGVAGQRHGAALARNLAWLVERASAFAAEPRAANLVGIKAGRNTGNWRDSEQGLGGGRYPYDVNAALVPAALEAAARIGESHLLDEFLDEAQRGALAGARAAARTWATRAAPLFAVQVSNENARQAVSNYSKSIGVEAELATRALGAGPLVFHAVSLDEQGRPIPVLNSDEGFRLLLADPPVDELAHSLDALMRPFPAGLVTDAGVVVANPAFAAPELQQKFSRFEYHGTVIWSWQQALLAAGLERQLRRADLPTALRTQLIVARTRLWAVIGNARDMRTSELWSWSYAGGRFRIEPFGRPGADVDESNAAQLWSTVYLGLRPPARND